MSLSRSARLLGLGLCLAGPLFAPLAQVIRLAELSQADAIVVGRVTDVRVGEALPQEQQRWRHPVHEYAAEVELLRFHADGEELRDRLGAARFVRVGYRAEKTEAPGGVFGGPVWPEITAGETRTLALRALDDGTFELWFEQGIGVTPPATEALRKQTAVADAIEFVEREAANSLASGDPAEALAMAVYLRTALGDSYSAEEPRPPLLRTLAQMLEGDLVRTQQAAAALLASQGIPKPSIADLAAAGAGEGMRMTPFYGVASWTIQQLADGDRERLVIEELLRDLSVYSWGAAMTLSELAEHPALDAPLSEAIEARRPHILFILETLIRKGRTDLIARAMPLVREGLEDPEDPFGDRQSAGRLLWDHGSEEDFELFLSLVQKAQREDLEHYVALWNAAAHYDRAPRRRELRMLAIYLPDSRILQESLRYCDLAVGRIMALSGERFGLDTQTPLGEAPLELRAAAAARAAEWLAARLAE